MNVLVRLLQVSDTHKIESLGRGDECREQNMISASNNEMAFAM
jgi:hypothetical protein